MVILMAFDLYVLCGFSLAAFNILYFTTDFIYSVYLVFELICSRLFLHLLCLFDVLCYYIHTGVYFLNLSSGLCH